MTLNGWYALHCSKDASFRAHCKIWMKIDPYYQKYQDKATIYWIHLTFQYAVFNRTLWVSSGISNLNHWTASVAYDTKYVMAAECIMHFGFGLWCICAIWCLCETWFSIRLYVIWGEMSFFQAAMWVQRRTTTRHYLLHVYVKFSSHFYRAMLAQSAVMRQ